MTSSHPGEYATIGGGLFPRHNRPRRQQSCSAYAHRQQWQLFTPRALRRDEHKGCSNAFSTLREQRLSQARGAAWLSRVDSTSFGQCRLCTTDRQAILLRLRQRAMHQWRRYAHGFARCEHGRDSSLSRRQHDGPGPASCRSSVRSTLSASRTASGGTTFCPRSNVA